MQHEQSEKQSLSQQTSGEVSQNPQTLAD